MGLALIFCLVDKNINVKSYGVDFHILFRLIQVNNNHSEFKFLF